MRREKEGKKGIEKGEKKATREGRKRKERRLEREGMGKKGELADIAWAPVSGYLITRMYPDKSGRIGGVIGFLEELIPGTDFIPTFTLMWLYTYVYKKDTAGKKALGKSI